MTNGFRNLTVSLLALAGSIGLSHAQNVRPRISVGQQLDSIGVTAGSEKTAGKNDSTGGVVRGGMLLHSITPLYPPNALDTGVTGIVTVEAVIGKDGRVVRTSVLDGPYPRRNAESAVKRFVYEPTLLNGKPVERLARVQMRYSLGH